VSQPNFVILYVDDPPRSADFYATLLGRGPAELSATFALFTLESGVMFGLWSKHTATPAVARDPQPGGGAELAFSVASKARVDELFLEWTGREWTGRGLRIAQAPVTLDFGYTFVALDPDHHRLRVFAAGETS
jgi:catechol 2,3-dioxygenase-like lactoylglutathione lyase family enzyme